MPRAPGQQTVQNSPHDSARARFAFVALARNTKRTNKFLEVTNRIYEYSVTQYALLIINLNAVARIN